MAGKNALNSGKATPRKGEVRRRRRSPGEIRERLLAAAREEFKRCGYGGARTAAIARKAEVTEAQLFRYYDSKADLFEDSVFEALNQHFSDFNHRHLSALEDAGDFRERERQYIREFLAFMSEHARLLLSLVVAETYSDDETSGVAAVASLRSYFERGAEMMAARVGSHPRVDPALMVRVSFAAVLGSVITREWLFAGAEANGETVDDAIVEFLLDGISANRRT